MSEATPFEASPLNATPFDATPSDAMSANKLHTNGARTSDLQLTEVLIPVPDDSGPAATNESITCPECGTVAVVSVNRRESADFCRNCDYPLFWSPSKVVRGPDSGAGDQALRRLPGTVGRVSIASLTCPSCAEPNAVTATVCIRCGHSLLPVEAPPPPLPPTPVYQPPAAVYEAPARGVPRWVWVLVGLLLVGVLVAAMVLAW
ncbi:MAG TPA: hypothetical protein VGH11_18000 [Jatrophihabitans sp.]|jgi:hypothetical protein